MDWRSKHFLGDLLLKRPLEKNELILFIKKSLEIIEDGQELIYDDQKEIQIYYLNNDLCEVIIHYRKGAQTLQLDVSAKQSFDSLNQDYEVIENKIQAITQLLDYEDLKTKEIKRHSFNVSKIKSELKIIYFVSTMTAICSMLYELLLAQSLSTVMGNTVLRYNMTIGLYIAAMGVGALFYNKVFNKDYFRNFIKTEILLSFVGVISPILVLVCDFAFRGISQSMQIDFFSAGIQLPMSFINHFFIILIGFLSGLELPLLTDMGRKFDAKNTNKVLAFDYLGTLLGAVLFPIIILPSLSLFTIGYVVSFLNLLVAMFVLYRFRLNFPVLKKILWAMVIIWPVIIFFSTSINNYIVEILYLGALK